MNLSRYRHSMRNIQEAAANRRELPGLLRFALRAGFQEDVDGLLQAVIEEEGWHVDLDGRLTSPGLETFLHDLEPRALQLRMARLMAAMTNYQEVHGMAGPPTAWGVRLYGIELCWSGPIARLFAVDCVEHALEQVRHRIPLADSRLNLPVLESALDTCRRFARGEASMTELRHASSDAQQLAETSPWHLGWIARATRDACRGTWGGGNIPIGNVRYAARQAVGTIASSDLDLITEGFADADDVPDINTDEQEGAWQDARLLEYLFGEATGMQYCDPENST